MSSEHIHHDGECQKMTTHNEDEEQHLSCPEDLSPDGTCHDFSCIGHAVDVWVCELELANDEAGVGCQDAQACDEDDAPIMILISDGPKRRQHSNALRDDAHSRQDRG